ncbi:MAG: LysR family transcriptional regulator [Negativicutes bacterium]|nr:LysR family transcriptional regulator [Negativicutes bacterium]
MSYWQSLAVFGAVVEEGSFSGAAKKLELTQPTVSFHIDNLERDFGCQLFQRTARGVTLTVYGEILLHHTSKINAQLSEAHNQIKAMLAGAAGTIALGASTIPAEYIVPQLIASFLRAQPGLRFSLHTGDSQTVLTGFASGDYPIAIVGTHPGNDHPVLELWPDELVLIAHPAICDQVGPAPSLAELLSFPFVARVVSSGSLRTVHAALESRGISPAQMRIVLEVGGNEALKSAVISQVGLAFISKWAIQQELQAGSLRIIDTPGLKIPRRFYAVCRQPLVPSCFQLFWDALAAEAAKNG